MKYTLPEKQISWLTAVLSRRKERLLWCLICTAVFSIIANGFSYFNLDPIHDAVHFTMADDSRWQSELGRFLIPVYSLLKGNISVPFLTGLLSILYLGLSVFIVTSVLDQRSRLEILLTSAFLSVNLFTVEINAVHQYFADFFLLSILLSLVGVYCLLNERRYSMAVALIALYASFGLYPASITFAFCMLVFTAFLEVIRQQEIREEMVRKWAIWAATFAVSGIGYLLSNRIVLLIMHTSPAEVAWSMGMLGRQNISELAERSLYHFKGFCQVFFTGRFTGTASAVATLILTISGIGLFYYADLRKRKKWLLPLFIILMVLFPVASRLVNVFTNSSKAFRTMYAQFLFLPFVLKLITLGINKTKEGWSAKLYHAVITSITVLSAVIICSNILFSNQAFTVQKVHYDRAVYHAGRIFQDLDSLYPERDGTEKVLVIGILHTKGEMDFLADRYRGIDGFSYATGLTYEYVFDALADYLGCPINQQQKHIDSVRALDEVQEMPIYPAPGYIAKVGDYIVIKLS